MNAANISPQFMVQQVEKTVGMGQVTPKEATGFIELMQTIRKKVEDVEDVVELDQVEIPRKLPYELMHSHFPSVNMTILEIKSNESEVLLDEAIINRLEDLFEKISTILFPKTQDSNVHPLLTDDKANEMKELAYTDEEESRTFVKQEVAVVEPNVYPEELITQLGYIITRVQTEQELEKNGPELIAILSELIMLEQEVPDSVQHSEKSEKVNELSRELLLNVFNDAFQKRDHSVIPQPGNKPNVTHLDIVTLLNDHLSDGEYNKIIDATKVNVLAKQPETIGVTVSEAIIAEESSLLLIDKLNNLIENVFAEKNADIKTPELGSILEELYLLDESVSENELASKALLDGITNALQKQSESSEQPVEFRTIDEVKKWIQVHLNNQTENNPITVKESVINFPEPRITHHTIQLTESDNELQTDKQLIKQFQTALKTSNFSLFKNGTEQLTLSLRPHHLGEMTVRLTQIQGEMTVKIIVSSQITKQMLESNMHELRNMFSPHQISVEEQEVETTNIATDHQEELDQEEQEHSGQSKQKNHKEDEQDIEGKFQDILMNLKV